MGSGYLHQNDVVFYHPCDNLVEHKEGKTWINYNDSLYFADGIIVSGVTRTANYDGRIESTDAAYSGCSGDTSWTFACWVRDDTAYSQQMWAGWYNGTDYDNLLKISLDFGATKIYISAGGINDDFTAKSRSPTGSGLYIVHVEFYGTTASGWISHNGSGWLSCGEVDVNQPDEQYDRVMCGKYNYTSKVGNAILDEAIFWHNTPKFTDTELLNLYNLFHEHGLTMDQYSSVGTPVNSDIDLFLHGYAQISGDTSLYIPGQYETESLDLFIQGDIQVSGSIDLYVSGSPPIASSSIDLYILVPTPVSGNINLYTAGPLFSNSGIDNFTNGHDILSNNIDQYIQGHQIISGNADLYISGIPVISSSISLHTVGPILIDDNVDNFIWGHSSISGNFTLFMKGHSPDIDVFVAVAANNPSDNINLFVYGAIPAESGVSYTNDTITLFINDSGEDTTVDSSWNAFTRVADPLVIPYSGIWQSFVRGGNVADNTTNLYLYGHASGDSPHGTPITNSSNAFIEGEGDLLSEDYFPINEEALAFAKVHLGLNNTFNLYISGEISIVQSTATSDLFIFGILDTMSGACTLYTIGNQSINNNCNLFIFGIQDLKSNNLPLYLEVTSVGSSDQIGDLYTHGF